MKQLVYFMFLCILLSACKSNTEEKVLVRPVKTIKITSVEELSSAKFPGVSQEVQTVQMAFRVAGPLTKLNVVEGQKVNKGQVLAEIDSRDFRVDLTAKEGRFIQARTEKDRYETLLARNAVSQNEYDQKLAVFLEAKSTYEAAQNALVDTRLIAPFDAFVDEKFAENNERVTIGQPIVSLLDLSALEVKFSVPDMLAAQYRNYDYFLVTFDIYPDRKFEADMKEVEKKSVGSAGIPVTIVLRDKNMPGGSFNITPGLSCNVQVVLKEDKESTRTTVENIIVPISALYEEAGSNDKYLWVVQTDSMRVTKRPVKTGNLSGQDNIAILSGLNKGETIVSAGGNLLSENQQVKYITNLQNQ